MNTNYRYTDRELRELWRDAHVEAVVFAASLASRIGPIRAALPSVKAWVCVADDHSGCPSWAIPYESVATGIPPYSASGCSGDDLLLLYTGGTTGLPKGVMWRQDDLYSLFSDARLHDPEDQDLDAVESRIRSGTPPIWLVASPLMHGTGWFTALQALCQGGTVSTIPGQGFDAERLLDTVVNNRVTALTIVGDAFARPILAALESDGSRWDLSGLRLIYSSGVTWSRRVKEDLLKYARKPPWLMCCRLPRRWAWVSRSCEPEA